MKIKKFKDFDITEYFKIEDFNTKIEVDSPTYGKYYMTKILSVDMISAAEDKSLIEAYDFYEKKLGQIMRGCKSVILDTKKFNGVDINKWEIYKPFKQDNLNWEDPKKHYRTGDLPVAVDKNRIHKILNNLIYRL